MGVPLLRSTPSIVVAVLPLATFPWIQVIRRHNNKIRRIGRKTWVPMVATRVLHGDLYFKLDFHFKTLIIDDTFFIGVVTSLFLTLLSKVSTIVGSAQK